LLQRLPHIDALGINCLWLQPFYPSPNKDDGYDVADYYAIDPRLGTLGDFVEFMHEADERGIRVITELVVNHTSDQHPWFQAARKDKGSPYRDYYIWSEEKPAAGREQIIFPPHQESVWNYDKDAGAYYYHQFYPHQPDLNVANAAVRDEIRNIMGFWLKLGVSGFRLDAAPFLVGRTPGPERAPREPFDYLEEFRQFLSWRRGDAIFLAEANVPFEEASAYFGCGPQIHMLFSFLVNQHVFLALARQSAAPLADILRKLPELPRTGQWANFLRNHDELDLGRLTEAERDEVYAAFGPEEHMRAYDRGIRRRLAPMLEGDRRRLDSAYGLLFSLPGTPVLRYGDEIGMGDDLALPERASVRTPMQWSDEENGGFSKAPRKRLIRPIIAQGNYGYEKINVASQQRDPESLLNWMERLIRVRKECPEIGNGQLHVLPSKAPEILLLRYQYNGGGVIAAHNLGNRSAAMRIEVDDKRGEHLVELLGDCRSERVDPSRQIEVPGFGFRWFRLCGGSWKLP
jgi:maltose alpha-D-glucosyltransferase/alpha-amylase